MLDVGCWETEWDNILEESKESLVRELPGSLAGRLAFNVGVAENFLI
jgi:hypothetical protein